MPNFADWERAWTNDPTPRTAEDDRFFSYCKHFMESRFRENCVSQNFQDAWVLYRTHEKQYGYYVDFGATDGDRMSNTKLLEDIFDWTGILAEPVPAWRDDLIRNRGKGSHIFTDACVSDRDGDVVPFVIAKDLLFSTMAGYEESDYNASQRIADSELIYVPTITLRSLLSKFAAPKYIDFLSIDTEGSEYDILKVFDFSEYRIGHICVEHNYTGKRAEIHELLTSQGYVREFEIFSRWDDFYRLNTI